MSRAVPVRPFWKVIDWKLVAACGLPVWAFVFGLLLSPRPARVAQATPSGPPTGVAARGTEVAPMPREIVVRETEPQVVPVPLVVPVPVGEPVGVVRPVEFRLPASELLPAEDRKSTRLNSSH